MRGKASLIIKLHYPHFIREQFKESIKISEHFTEYFPADFFKTDNVSGPSDYCADYPGKSGVSLIYVSEKYVKEIYR